MDSTRCYGWYEAQFLRKIKRIKSEKKGACLAVILCSRPWAVVGGLNWLSRLFVLQFCNVLQLSFLSLYRCIYFLMILHWGVSAKRTENQQQQSIASLLPTHRASEGFAFHTSFTACGCEAATKTALAQAASHHQKPQLAARIQNFTEKICGEKYFYKQPQLLESLSHCRNEIFLFSMSILFQTKQSSICQNVLCIKGDVKCIMLCSPRNNLFFECLFELYLFTLGTNTSTEEYSILSRRLKKY